MQWTQKAVPLIKALVFLEGVKIKSLFNCYKKEILTCGAMLVLIVLLCFSVAITVRGCSESLSDGTTRQGIVDIGKGVKSIIEDINKDET